MLLRRSTARTLTRVAQVVSVVSLALLGATIMLPVRPPEIPEVEVNLSAPSDLPVEDDAGAPLVPRNDWTLLASSLSEIREPLLTAATTTAAATDDDSTPDGAGAETDGDELLPNPAPPGWQYVGYAISPDGAVSALVTINANQQFVRPGMTLESFAIAEVTTERLLLERDDRRFEVKRVDPLPFDPAASAMNARARGESARGRTARLEQQRMQQLEETRRRRAEEARQSGEIPDEGERPNR